MRKLSGIDATFLYMETNETPMHISSLLMCEPAQKGEHTSHLPNILLHLLRIHSKTSLSFRLKSEYPFCISAGS